MKLLYRGAASLELLIQLLHFDPCSSHRIRGVLYDRDAFLNLVHVHRAGGYSRETV